jgi:phosphohistidine swiveling domain-containing protein
MDNTYVNEVSNKLLNEDAESVVRDISFLTCTIFTYTHLDAFKKIFNWGGFSIIFWFGKKDGQVIFYKSIKEYALFGKEIGGRYLKDVGYAEKVADILIKMSDEINAFIRENKNVEQLSDKWDAFYIMYRDFFAYHQSIYWPSEYLLKIKPSFADKGKIDKIIGILDKAYKYNERVIPSVDQYFSELGIGHLSCDEAREGVAKYKKMKNEKRSVLLFNNGVQILPFEKAKEIYEAVENERTRYLGDSGVIKGQGVSAGVVKGKVKLITDMGQLKDCETGDILVTSQTRPQYNNFIKNVAAIVTDEGGLLCHASMLAREFKIPCVVGTKNATKFLKDGDLVEVDAENGTVKIIK